MKRRGIMILLGLLIVAAIGGCSDGDREPPAGVANSDTSVTVSGDGKIEASYHEKLTFGSGGKIARVATKEGDRVKQGDVLAELDTRALELAETQARVALAQEQVALTQAQAALAQARLAQQKAERDLANAPDTEAALELALYNAQIDVRKAEHYLNETRDTYTWPDIEIAKKDVENAEAFLQYAMDQNLPEATITYAQERLDAAEAVLDAKTNAYDTEEVAIAKMQLEAAQRAEAQAQRDLDELSEELVIKTLEVEAAKESVEYARQNVNLAQANVDLAQQSLDQAEEDLAEATIVAPFDGLVARVGVKEGEFLLPAAYTETTIIELIDLSHMKLTARVDELDVVKVKTRQKAMIIVDAMPEMIFEGWVTFISPVARESGAVLFEDEDEEKEYEVEIDFDTPANSPIRDGMSATTEIIVE